MIIYYYAYPYYGTYQSLTFFYRPSLHPPPRKVLEHLRTTYRPFLLARSGFRVRHTQFLTLTFTAVVGGYSWWSSRAEKLRWSVVVVLYLCSYIPVCRAVQVKVVNYKPPTRETKTKTTTTTSVVFPLLLTSLDRPPDRARLLFFTTSSSMRRSTGGARAIYNLVLQCCWWRAK